MDKELPKELLECINLTSAENCNSSIEAVEKAFNTAVESRVEKIVNEKLRGSSAPKIGVTNSNELIEKQIAAAMGLKQN